MSCYFTLNYNKNVILSCFICNHHKTLLISQIIITKHFLSQKFQINSFLMFSDIIFCCRQLNLPPSKDFDLPDAANIERCPHRDNIEINSYIKGSVDRGKVCSDSDLNLLDSVFLMQYTTVTNHCW